MLLSTGANVVLGGSGRPGFKMFKELVVSTLSICSPDERECKVRSLHVPGSLERVSLDSRRCLKYGRV